MLNFTSFMNVSVLNTGGWILTDGVHNFAGTLVPANVVEFPECYGQSRPEAAPCLTCRSRIFS